MQNRSFILGIFTGVCGAAISLVLIQSVGMGTTRWTVGKKMDHIASLLEENYVEEVNETAMADGAFWGMTASLGDPYTTYFTADEMQSFLTDLEGSFCGVGVTVIYDEDAQCLRIVSVMDGYPAKEAGLQAGDYIIAVDGEDVRGQDGNTVAAKIQGKEGTEVTLQTLRGQQQQTYTLTRQEVQVQSVYGQMRPDGLAYIAITSFNSNTYDQFSSTLTQLRAQNPLGLILDLRDNTGGILDVANEIADYLMGEGVIVYTVDKAGNRVDYTSDADALGLPLAVLVNGQSASASEVLSGAIQAHGDGILVGTQTFGKGLVQKTFGLEDGSALKITVEKYYTPNDVCIQGVGLTPDEVVELPEGKISPALLSEGEEDTQLERAASLLLEDAG